MSLFANEIASKSSLLLMAIPVTLEALYSVVAHLRTNSSLSSS